MTSLGGCQMSAGMLVENVEALSMIRPKSRVRLEGCMKDIRGADLCHKKSPFDTVPLEVLGNIFLEYYYDEEVQQNCGYFIGANWKRWSSAGTPTSATTPAYHLDNGDVDMGDDEGQPGHPGAVLGLVCRSWRRVFLSTPRLWSSIRVWLNFPYHFYQSQQLSPSSMGRRERDLDGIVREIDTHLIRSRAVPLFIEIQTNCLEGNAPGGGEVLNRVLGILGGGAWRIHELMVKRTDHAGTRGSLRRLPPPPVFPPVSGLVSPPYPLSPGSPCGRRISHTTDDVALGALEEFITGLDRLQHLTLDNWTQDAVLNFATQDEEPALSDLRNITLLSSSPTFCCNGIPWSQITHFTSHNCKYNHGQLLDLLGAMQSLTHLDLRLCYNDPGVVSSPYPSPAPSPSPHSSRHNIAHLPNLLERDGSTSPRRHTHLRLPTLTHLTLQGLLKSIQLLLGTLKTPHLTTLNLNSFEAGIGVTQVLPDQSPCESMFRFLRRSQCALEWMRVDTMFLIPPQPHRSSHQDPNYVYSYILKPTFTPLRSLKTLVIGRGPAEIVVKLLLALAWKGDPSAADVFPELEEIGCEMKLGHVEADALCAVVMSRIPSRVVFVRQQQQQMAQGHQGRRVKETGSARLWPISPLNSSTPSSSSCTIDQQQQLLPKKFPTRLRALQVPSAKSDIYIKLRHHFRSWFPDFPQDPDMFLPQTFC